MFLHVDKINYINEYKINIVFNDGKVGIADLHEIINKPLFSILKNKEYFARFKIDPDLKTIAWNNGLDLAPEYLYYLAFKNNPEYQNLFKKWGYC